MSDAAEEPLRDVRRIVLVGLVLAIAAAGVALGLGLRDGGSAAPTAAAQRVEFPATYTETGFVDHALRLGPTAAAAAAATRLDRTLDTGGGGTIWLVARCTRGTVTVSAVGAASSRPCTGKPVGVAALGGTGRTMAVQAVVSVPQSGSWGVAIYR